MARLTREQIKEIIPHRDPFLFLDEVVELEPGRRAVAVKEVRADEPHFRGHFPGQPIMPGVLIVEALAQAGAVAALSLPDNRGKLVLFAGIDGVRFKRQVVPGDTLRLSVEMTRMRGPVGKAQAEAHVDAELACRAELTFAIAEREE
ncbi:MAG: 3-hydroxyacyl-ACP dehydratase FabZ [Thermoleophilia bacterium]|nr:3-hydroxyacyl-ACP dehydratase FabZ [Thermoleophilia bacterium]